MPSTANQFTPDDDKLKELILFIAQRSEGDKSFDAIKLNKLLFFADFAAYAKLGKSITGHAYQKLPNGPAPRKLLPVTEEMAAEGSFAWAQRNYYGLTQKAPIALREANLDAFTAAEIAIVTDVLKSFEKNNAKEISDISHKFDGWKLAEMKETIPYESALVEFGKPRNRDIQRALAVKSELAALVAECAASDGES